MRLVVGQRDRKHRRFLGWRIQTSDDFQLDPSGTWYNRAGVWTDRTKAHAAMAKEVAAGEVVAGTVRLIRVFALEPPLRTALRELVDALDPTERDLPVGWRVQKLRAAKRALEES
jgi:hypothetical protein